MSNRTDANEHNIVYRPSTFVNYGTIQANDAPIILSLCLDTWYYVNYQHLGRMRFREETPFGAASNARFIAQQFTSFAANFAPIARLRGDVTVIFKRTENEIEQRVFRFTCTNEAEFLSTLEAYLTDTGVFIVSVNRDIDVLAATREYSGDVRMRWLDYQGNLHISAPRRHPALDVEDSFRWVMTVNMSVASLFLSDNQPALERARNLWKELLRRDPTIDKFPEELDEPLIVTLATPPAHAPKNNADLFRLNAPRLLDSISRWERSTGEKFHQLVSIE